MKKLLAGLAVTLAFALPLTAQAKCYSFDKVKGLKVCVHGDSFPDRDKAKNICKSAKGTDCGNVSSYSSSCNGSATTRVEEESVAVGYD